MKGTLNTEPRRVAPIPADRCSERCRANLRGISIREVRADDRDRIANAFRALGPQTIYKRFFFPKRDVSDEELRRLTECDNVRDAVLVATAASGDEEIIVGLGHCARTGASADVAFTVAEDYQGRGIASELLRQLAQIARRTGISRFEADVLADNAPMLKVFRRSGLPVQETRANQVVHLTMPLETDDRSLTRDLPRGAISR
jgi:RimJ/RimL family protein N-acetyltransferase